MTRSGSNTSLNSAGSGRTPFFEKYAQQVAGPSSAAESKTTWGAGAASSPTLSRFRQPPSAPVRHHMPQSSSNGSSLSSLSSASPTTSSDREVSSAATSPGDEYPNQRGLKDLKGVPVAGRRQPPHPRPDLPLPSMPSRPGLPSHPSETTGRGRLYPGGSANGVACRAPVSTLPARPKVLSGASRYRRPIPTADSPKDTESPMSSGGLGLSNVATPRNEAPPQLDVEIPSTSPSHSRSSSLSDQYQGVGLEGLMGDLMAAMDPSEAASSNGDQDILDFTAAYADRTPRPGDVPVMPSTSHKRSPGDVRPDDSISQRDPLRPPSVMTAASSTSLDPSRCHRCRKAFPPNATSKDKLVRPVSERGRSVVSFCRPCYADLYLPKCRRCEQPIEKGAVTDRVGKVLGKYHPKCFTCVECSERFETGEFYVWERNPVVGLTFVDVGPGSLTGMQCYRHYHQLAGTTCCNETCGQGIEGPCVALSLSDHNPSSSSDDAPLRNSDTRRLYHPEHFTCSKLRCGVSLHEYHFLVGGKPWCERHAVEEEERQAAEEEKRRRAAGGGGSSGVARKGTEKAKKRRTVVMNVRGK